MRRLDWVIVAQDRGKWGLVWKPQLNLHVPSNAGNFLTKQGNQILGKNFTPWIQWFMYNMRSKQHSDCRSVYRTVITDGEKGIFSFHWHPYIYIYIYIYSHTIALCFLVTVGDTAHSSCAADSQLHVQGRQTLIFIYKG